MIGLLSTLHMLGPFTFTFTLESEEFEKFEKVGCWVCTYQTLITTRAPDGANNVEKNCTIGKGWPPFT